MRVETLSLVVCVTWSLVGCASEASSDTDTDTDTDGTSSSSSTSGADTSSSGDAACQELTIDLGDEPCVRFGEHELADFLDDCGPVTCAPRSGPGDGRFPLGLSVGPDCTFQGIFSEDRIGGWAQLVDVERDGLSTPVAFCAVQDTTPSGYTVEFEQGAVARQTFDPAGAISLGDPVLRVRPATDCGADCGFSLAFDRLDGGFDAGTPGLISELDDSGTLTQTLDATADEVPAEFADRPWVFSIDVNYCIQAGEACSMINPNTEAMDAFSAFAMVMVPEGS
ncbi:MAG: hypothetical protein ACE37F_29540 [Nannocystaceae bacterium]|nr:hypothetical protein [bacterium]